MSNELKREASRSLTPTIEIKKTKIESPIPSSSILPSTTESPLAESTTPTTRPVKANQSKRSKRQSKPIKAGGAEETAYFDVVKYFGLARHAELQNLELVGRNFKVEAELEWGNGSEGKDIEVAIVGISAHGDGLALLTPTGSDRPTRLLEIPFALPEEIVKVHIHRHEFDTFISHGDLLEIVKPSSLRLYAEGEVKLHDVGIVSERLLAVRKKFGERVQCKYFGTCSGCQYQPLAYDAQLLLKQTVVQNAFQNFSKLSLNEIPGILPTLPSPKEYAYRTKLTPHFQSPPDLSSKGNRNRKGKGKEDNSAEPTVEKEWELTIGFDEKGRKRVIDIEECVLATKTINEALVHERAKIHATISKYKRGSTLLLRDSLPPRPEGSIRSIDEIVPSPEAHIAVTDHKATVREQIGTIELEQMAGSFFQNNNSILPSLMEYVASTIYSSSSLPRSALNPGEVRAAADKRYLIDTYCGSGLFALCLADHFDEIEGVEIDKNSVKWAIKNAEFNKGEGRGKVDFIAGNAEAIFSKIQFPPNQTTILIDPPRKGCDEAFITQLLAFNPATIIYISCNVHTQARDVGQIVTRSNVEGKLGFKIESLRAADLFCETHHAEGIAILKREIV